MKLKESLIKKDTNASFLYKSNILNGSLIKIENDEILIFPVKPLNSIDLVNKFPFKITD